MKRRTFTAALALGLPFGALWRSALSQAHTKPDLVETPSLSERVKAGALPSIDKRLPEKPSMVAKFYGGEGPGHCGGELNMLVANARDTRLMTIYANARLIVYDPDFKQIGRA